MKRLLIAAGVVGLLLALVGPIRERIGRWLTASTSSQQSENPTTRVQSADSTPSEADDVQSAIQEYRMRSAKRVKQVQRALKQAGFDPGSMDGLIGHRTHTALIEFQKARRLEPDGVLGVKTWEALSTYMRPGDAVAKQEPMRGD